MELRKRGIKSSVIDDNLLESHQDNTSEILKIAAEKKLRILQNRNLPEDKLKQKLITYLLGKGFNYDEIKSRITILLSNS
jgi:SOS response regulatory protein OraA/RecX